MKCVGYKLHEAMAYFVLFTPVPPAPGTAAGRQETIHFCEMSFGEQWSLNSGGAWQGWAGSVAKMVPIWGTESRKMKDLDARCISFALEIISQPVNQQSQRGG